MDTDLPYKVGVLILQISTLLRLVVLAAFGLKARGWKVLPSLQATYNKLLAQWSAKHELNLHAVEHLDWLRCRTTCRVWNAIFAFGMCRMISGQIQEALGFQRVLPELDYSILFFGAVGFLLKLKPGLITPRSLDVWYVGTSLILNVTLVPAAFVEVRDVLVLSFAWRFLFAVLAKRAWCAILCTLIHVLQIIWMARLQAAEGEFESGDINRLFQVAALSTLMLLGIFLARGLLEENAILKQDLKGRTVELGAVSSLLTACYDAVLEAP